MKAKEAPEKIYVHIKNDKVTNTWNSTFIGVRDIEYTRTDAFIEKACEFWKDHMAGYDICEDDIKRSIESFKLAMNL